MIIPSIKINQLESDESSTNMHFGFDDLKFGLSSIFRSSLPIFWLKIIRFYFSSSSIKEPIVLIRYIFCFYLFILSSMDS